MDTLTQRQEQRWLMLDKYYELTDGRSEAIINLWNVGDELGWNRELTRSTYDYLKNEGLLEAKAMGGASGITHWGVKEVEAAKQGIGTEHFAPNFVVNINSPGSNIVAGNRTTAVQNSGTISTADQLGVLERILHQVESPLPQDAVRLVETARHEPPNKYEVARAAEELGGRGGRWREALTQFCTGAGAGILVEAIKFGLGLK